MNFCPPPPISLFFPPSPCLYVSSCLLKNFFVCSLPIFFFYVRTYVFANVMDIGGIQEMCPKRQAERHPYPTRSFEGSSTNNNDTNNISAQLWLLLVFCWKVLQLAATSFGSAKTRRQHLQGAQLRLVVVSMMLLCTGQCLAQTCLCQQRMSCQDKGLTTTQAFENLPCNLATRM